MKKKENLIKKELLFTGERAMPLAPNMDEQVMREHWARYRYTEPLIKGKNVLDVACGSGYGSNLLAQTAKTIVGGDIEKETIEYCKEKYQRDNLKFEIMDIRNIPYPDNSFDTIVSFETIEHIKEWEQFLKEIRRLVVKDGSLIISTPLGGPCGNHFHLSYFQREDFKKILTKYFKNVNIIYQRDDEFYENSISPLFAETFTGEYAFAVCINPIKVKKPTISIILLTFNALEYTKKCVDSILANTKYYPYEIVFVDNASTDGSVEYLRRLVKDHDNFTLIENKENKGFAGGNNQGVEAASGEYVMLLNNDVLVSNNWLSRMVNSIEKHKKIGTVGPVTNRISGRQSYVGQYEGDDYEDFAQFIENENKGKLTPRRRLAGFAMLMKKNIYEEVDGFDETFGVGNFEDDDMSLKVRSKGLALMVDESVFIHHYGSQTFKENRIDIVKNLNERMPIFKKKWPDIDYSELLEINNPLDKLHSSYIDNGIKALENSDFSSAEIQFSQILKDNPISEEALYGLTLCSRSQDDNLKAFEYVNELLKLNPNHSEALNQFGLIMVEQEKLSDARNAFILAIEIAPRFVEVQRNLAELYILEEDYETGVQTYLRILKSHPEDIPSLLRMAELNREANNTHEASEWAKMVLDLEPENLYANQFV